MPAPATASFSIRKGLEKNEPRLAWRLALFRGRLTELSGNRAQATLALVFRLILEAQQRAEPVVWIRRVDSVFYPPDVAKAGVDLAALPVVSVPETKLAARAADHLLRSGGFGIVLLDVGRAGRIPTAHQARLTGLAKKHDAALLCLTEKDDRQPSLGSLVSKRGERSEDRFRCEVQVLKDKRHGPGWRYSEVFHGPDGLH
jgi:recombination protein RecA